MATDWRDPGTAFDMTYDRHGMPPKVAFFDPTPVVPVSALADRLAVSEGIRITEGKLADIISSGWVRPGELTYEAGALGIALYEEARIVLLLELESFGYSASELLMVVREDEELVQDLREFGFDYEDDDPQVMLRMCDREISRLEHQLEWSEHALTEVRAPLKGATRAVDLVTPETVADLREQLQHVRGRREKWVRIASSERSTWTPQMRRAVEKAAFLVRDQDERTRFFIWQWHRDQILEGFSPLIELEAVEAVDPVIDWEATLKSPRFLSRPAPVRLRFPGGVVEGERLTTTRAMTPTEYREFYERWNLESYYKVLAEVRNRRICANCLAPIAADADHRRTYCHERCRSAARTRAWRGSNPRRATEHKRRYYRSLPELD